MSEELDDLHFKPFPRTGHYAMARKIAIDDLGFDSVAIMDDIDIKNHIYMNYMVLNHYDDGLEDNEEELILIPRDAYEKIRDDIKRIYR